MMGVYQSWVDRTRQLNCPDSWNICEIPPRPYTLDMDRIQDPQLCTLLSGTQNEITAARTATTAIRTIRLVLRIIRAIRMLIKARRIGDQITKVIRARVSKHSRRYQKLGFDLDLSYITTRVCCMASPAVNRLYTLAVDGERVGVNDAYMMSRFLATRHYHRFRIFNFCAEEIGNYAIERLFGQVKRMPVKEKHPPTLADVLVFCENSAHYLFTDENNILVLHCDSGKDRSGVFAASFLLYSGHSSSASAAINTFTLRRTGEVCIPCTITSTIPCMR
jgi:PTEN phosphatase family protein